ncbi:MAG: hypothetical protein CYPHOPRED_005870 [Cyphobasidiales sp. Tagirdzhanova-0007]|nr:MAG: hypothetical protein CYPHOPRED_005870 [Cyphobasidiales sp. Tagirdzhanova-0007]
MGDSKLVDHNRAYFDKLAADYDTNPWQIEMTAKITAFIRDQLDFIGCNWAQPIRLLDYACGSGMVTKALSTKIQEAIGLDVSSKMVDRYNDLLDPSSSIHNASGQDLHAHAIIGDLLTFENPSSKLTSPDLFDFDLVAIGLGFHHFDSPS